MNQKASLPSLTGHRVKTRKRDEKKQFDPTGFRDTIIVGLNEAGDNLDSVSKFLDQQSSKLDYRRYGCELIEILVAGGLLAPGGALIQDENGLGQTSTCVFGTPADSMEGIRAWACVFTNLFRRYKYLEKMHEEALGKMLIYLKAFSPENRKALAQITALWLSDGHVPPAILLNAITEHQVKDGLALQFFLDVMSTLKAEKGGPAVVGIVKKAGIDSRLTDFFPVAGAGQTEAHMASVFAAANLNEIVEFRQLQAAQSARNDLTRLIVKALQQQQNSNATKPKKDVVEVVSNAVKRHSMAEAEIIVLLWNCLMRTVDCSKKEDLVHEQALLHIRRHDRLLKTFISSVATEVELLNRIQDFCYDNTLFIKIFSKIALLLYKTDVISEEAVLKWHKSDHTARGWTVFHEQTKKFVEWLETADDEDDDDDDDDDEDDESDTDNHLNQDTGKPLERPAFVKSEAQAEIKSP